MPYYKKNLGVSPLPELPIIKLFLWSSGIGGGLLAILRRADCGTQAIARQNNTALCGVFAAIPYAGLRIGDTLDSNNQLVVCVMGRQAVLSHCPLCASCKIAVVSC